MIARQILLVFAVILAVDAFVERPGFQCKRPCSPEATRFKCRYDFRVTEHHSGDKICGDATENCTEPGILRINGQTPGPAIEVCLGDVVEVILHNRLSSQEISLHWNGLSQSGTAHMDGVSMVSQCPVLPFSSFRYNFKADNPGTGFYHAHLSAQQGDGLFGALIVRDFHDNSEFEDVLMIGTRTSSPLSWFLHYPRPHPVALTVNGKVNDNELHVRQGRHYRLRLINANVLNCPVAVSVVEHTLQVIAVGNNPVKSIYPAKRVIVFPGEKIDIELEANQPPGKYLLAVEGLHECRNFLHKTTLTYDHVDVTTSHDNTKFVYLDAPEYVQGHGCQDLGVGVLCSMDLTSRKDQNMTDEVGIYYVPFDLNYYSNFVDDMTDYSFNIYGFSYYPSYLTASTAGAEVAQVNKMAFKYPPSPILSQPEAVPESILCTVDHRSTECENNPEFCECLQLLAVAPNSHVELILINEGKRGNLSQVFHVHGYSVSVVAVQSFEMPITQRDIATMNERGLLHRNLLDPPKMDTLVVPSRGFVIVRFYTGNLGYWLWEARSTGVFPATDGPTMQFLMRVGTRENLPTVPIDFPTCGNHKGPDLICG